jgi:hypothetical protein
MQQGSRARRWLSGGVLGLAALACIATSRARWMVEAELPAGAAVQTPAGGTQAILVTVEASTMPSVDCQLAGSARVQLRPLAEPAANSATAPDPRHVQYLCPPGGRIIRVAIDGSGGGGSHAKPPADAFVRITKLETVETWTSTSQASFPIEPWRYSKSDADVTVAIAAPHPVYVAAALDEGTDTTAFGGVNILGPSRDGRTYDFVMAELKGAVPPGSKLRVWATTFGVCEPGCTPPAPDVVTLAPAPQ